MLCPKFIVRPLVLFLCILLSGCVSLDHSFSPIVQEQLAHTRITRIPNEDGQVLRLALIKMFTPEGLKDPWYELTVTLSHTTSILGMSLKGEATRTRLTTTATYEIYTQSPRKCVHKGKLIVHGSYHYITQVYYANTLSEESTRRANLDRMSSLMFLEVGQYFKQATDTAAQPRSPS